MNPKIAAEIALFEQQWNFKLPEDYRHYIIQHGFDGLTGRRLVPRLLPPEEWFAGFPYDSPGYSSTNSRPEDKLSSNFLSEPCPITLGADLTPTTTRDYAHIKKLLPGETKEQAQVRSWKEGCLVSRRWVTKLPPHEIDPFQGTICITYHGCTYYDLLIVTGPARGRILNIDADYGVPFFDKAPNFSEYIKRRLAEK